MRDYSSRLDFSHQYFAKFIGYLILHNLASCSGLFEFDFFHPQTSEDNLPMANYIQLSDGKIASNKT
jgi:hypothetical protein